MNLARPVDARPNLVESSFFCATFSIVAHCQESGQLGMAIATALPGVGGLCCFVEAGVGAVATQSWVNPGLGSDALNAMRAGTGAGDALTLVLSKDADAELRQLGIVDANGVAAAHTGADCTEWAGHRTGAGFSVQGNMLVGEATLDAMAEVFGDAADLDLAERLMRALEAGQAAGGDRRGKQSAALLVHEVESWPLIDLRVDDHSDPVAELRRIHLLAKVQLTPFVRSLPGRQGPGIPLSDAERAMLLASPATRPGRPEHGTDEVIP